jgi:hypothetical protein
MVSQGNRSWAAAGAEVEGADALFVLAQISTAIAGFTGIVTALRARGDLHPWDRARTIGLILVTVNLLLLSLLPFALHAFGVLGSLVWKSSSAIGVLLAIASLGVMPWTLPSHQRPPYLWFFPTTGSALTLVHVANVFVGSFGLFYLVLVASLLIGVLQFAHIVIVRPRE